MQIGSTQSEPQAVGCDGGKKVKGRKRHILVDTWGLLMVVVVTAANIAEREGAKLVLAKSIVRTDLWSQGAILEKKIVVRMGFNQSRVKS